MKKINMSYPTSPASNNRLHAPLSAAIAKLMTLVMLPIVMPLSLAAHAEMKEGAYEFSPFVGKHFFDEDQNLEDDVVYGGRFGYNFTSRFAVEGSLSRVGSNVDDTSILGSKEGQYRSPMNGVDVTFYDVSALYHFMPESNFNPYIAAGFGAAHYSPEIADKDMSAFNIGVGAKYWLSENVALRFDVRDYMVSELVQEHFHNVQATVGLVFSFGGSAKSTPVVISTPPAKVAAAPVAQNTPVKPEEIVLEFDDVHFDFDKSTLTPEARVILGESVKVLKDNPKAKVRVAGYTSASGSAEYNQALSERRAQAIKDFLIAEGIKPNRLTTVGYGDERPAQHETTPTNLRSTSAKANMRALFEIVVQ